MNESNPEYRNCFGRPVNPRIVCKDGFSISVQARESAYCHPREDVGPWTQMECGYPSEKPLLAELLGFAELISTDDYTKAVFPYVPVELIMKEIELHGGIVEGQLPS